MMAFGPLSLAAPAVLAGAAALPLLWWLIRRLPPPTRRIMFPAIRLLGPVAQEPPPQARPPWWLVALRLGALTLLLLGLAGPSWNLQPDAHMPRRILLVLDNGWQSAPAWADMTAAARQHISRLDTSDGRVALAVTAPPPGGWPDGAQPVPDWVSPATALARLELLTPQPWPADRLAAARAVTRMPRGTADESLWISHGWDALGAKSLARALQAVGPARLQVVDAPTFAIRQFDGISGGWMVQLVRPQGMGMSSVRLVAVDEAGRRHAETTATFQPGETTAAARVIVPVGDLPRISRIEVLESRSAATTALVDSNSVRPHVALFSGEPRGERRPLQSATYYVRRALEPYASVKVLPVEELTAAEANLRVFIDLPVTDQRQSADLLRWVERGGIAVTFAGARVAENGTRLAPGPLLTATRTVGTRLSWDQPQPLGGFAADSPLAGLTLDPDVTVTRQVLGDPSAPGLARWAWLKDGTPLVTARSHGAGLLVMVHTNADPRWSNLPLSGLFEQMLRRLLPLVRSGGRTGGTAQAPFSLEVELDGDGLLTSPRQPRLIEAAQWENVTAGPETPPGLYRAGAMVRALNVMQGSGPVGPRFQFQPLALDAGLPMAAPIAGRAAVDLATPLLIIGLVLAALDGLLVAVRGLTARGRFRRSPRAAALLLGLWAGLSGLDVAPSARAQSIPDGTRAQPIETVELGYVATGNPVIDARTRAGLEGLTRVLAVRTAVRAAPPRAVQLGRDNLGKLAMLYWPLPSVRTVTPAVATQLSSYIANGGLIVVDLGATPPPPAMVRATLAPLNLPRLAPLTSEHVLARSFYLLERFPGRVEGHTVWIEAGTQGRDGAVAGVVIGSSDWVGAWGSPDGLSPRQREWALRFGVNLVMYALTGTYKADQVHVKAILDRLPERAR